MKKLIISTDTGYNGIKCVVGEYAGEGEVTELFNFHVDSNIIETTNLTSASNTRENSEGSIFIREETDNSKRNYVAGAIAKQYLASPNNKGRAEDDPFYNPKKDEFERFTTPSFKKLHLAAIYKALKMLSELDGYDVINNPNDFRLKLEVQLPHVVQQNEDITDKIKGYIKDKNKALKFQTCSDEDYQPIPEILAKAEVGFCSQVLAATIGELIDEPEYANKKPVFVIDCGGKTVGIAVIETTDEVSAATSNTEYAIGNVNEAAVEEISEKTSGDLVISAYQIEEASQKEELAIANDSSYGGTRYYSESEDKSTKIKISEIYEKNIKEKAKALAKFCFDEYRAEAGRAELILVAGGAGVRYYDTLKKEFGKRTDAPVVLAKGTVGEKTNGSIYSIAVGGLKLAALDYIDEE